MVAIQRAKVKSLKENVDIVKYNASKTLTAFHLDDSFVRTVIGPLGSGKSVGCIMELVRRAFLQKPNRKGIRKSRWAVIRNTYRELIDTTIKTFFDWIDPECGDFIKMDMTFILRAELPDGTLVEAEFLFRALDRPNDVKKLLSLELTGGFINEGKEIPKQIVDMLQGRVGRYPSKRDGGPTWWGVVIDTNPPDDDSWYYKLFEENLPENHRIFHQPSGLAPDAENVENLPPGYYQNMMAGKDIEWINVYVHGQYGFIADGKAVYSEYQDRIHWSDVVYTPDASLPLYVGIDFGLTPAAAFGQVRPSGQLVLFDELCTFDMGAVSFGKLLKQRLNTEYKAFKDIRVAGDPAGKHRAQTDEVTPFMILAAHGINAYPTYTNDFTIRREVTAEQMSRLAFGGNPAYLVCGKAKTLRKALGGGYKYAKLNISGSDEIYKEKPNKNKYSHIAEAAQYLALDALGGDRVIGNASSGKPIDYSQTNRAVI